MKTYKAIAPGYDNVTLRQKGDVFQFGGKPGSWMQEVSPVVPAKAGKPAATEQQPEKPSKKETSADAK